MAADLICVQASCCSAPIRTHRVLPNWLWHALHLFWTSVRPAAAAAEEVIQFEKLQTVIGLMLDLICSGRSCLFFKSSLKVGLYWAALSVYYQQWSWFIFNFSSFVFCNCFLQDKHNIWFMLFTFLYYICVCVCELISFGCQRFSLQWLVSEERSGEVRIRLTADGTNRPTSWHIQCFCVFIWVQPENNSAQTSMVLFCSIVFSGWDKILIWCISSLPLVIRLSLHWRQI